MKADENISVEEDIFYEYTFPSDVGPNGLDSASNISNLTKGLPLPQERSSEVPSQLKGEGAQSTLISIIDHLNSALGIDAVSIAADFVRIILIILLTYLAAKIVRRAVTIHLHKVIATVISRLLVAVIYIAGFLLAISQIPILSRLLVTLLAGVGVTGIVLGLAAQSTISNIV
jgi:small conductance mechanosensitive channel